MPAKLFSAATIGIDAIPIEVEVDTAAGLHAFHIVGLGDKAVAESKERVSSAIKNSGIQPPSRLNKRVTVNLAPADLKKEGSSYDLAIAIGWLLASGQIFPFETSKKLFLGELALDGTVRRVSGVLPIVEMAQGLGFETIFLPKDNLVEASFFKNVELIPVSSLQELVLHLDGSKPIRNDNPPGPALPPDEDLIDFAEIGGLEQVKRALEITASGGHNILFRGFPGTGKTLLARALPSILPRLRDEEAIEVTKIYSVAGLLDESAPMIFRRPFRAPHHTASAIAIVGGGSIPKPGEVSLAHRGVLFLDEFPEFPRSVIENLRQPLEDGFVTVARVRGALRFPAKFILVAAMNPCPCGWYGSQEKECSCRMQQVLQYGKKISGPILDRIDIIVTVPKISYEKLSRPTGETSREIRERVIEARKVQTERFLHVARKNPIFTNTEMSIRDLKSFCRLTADIDYMLERAMQALHITPRGIHRIVKVSRTIADLDGSSEIKERHVSEALQYRSVESLNF